MEEKKGIIRRVLSAFTPKGKNKANTQNKAKQSKKSTKTTKKAMKKSKTKTKKPKQKNKGKKKIKQLTVKKDSNLKWPKSNKKTKESQTIVATSPKEIDTAFDIVLAYVNAKGKVSGKTIRKELNLSQKEITEVAKILGEEGLITVEYPLVGGIKLVKIGYNKKEKKVN